MIAAILLTFQTAGEPAKHMSPRQVPHSLFDLLKFAHGVPAIAAALVIVVMVCFAFYKISGMKKLKLL
jgi:hypothetical protein